MVYCIQYTYNDCLSSFSLLLRPICEVNTVPKVLYTIKTSLALRGKKVSIKGNSVKSQPGKGEVIGASGLMERKICFARDAL